MTFEELKEAAESGHRESQYELGDHFYEKEENFTQAFRWFHEAAKQRHPDAQYRLGMMLHEGKGEAKNPQAAAECFKGAASQGHVRAQFNLGVMYLQGDGVAKDSRSAAVCFQDAAEAGHPFAQINLGQMYLKGDGVEQDDHDACYWLLIARAHPALEQYDKDQVEDYLREAEKYLLESSKISAQRQARLWWNTKRPTDDIPNIRPIVHKSYNHPESVAPPGPDDKDEGGEVVFEKIWASGVVVETRAGKGSGVIVRRPDIVATNWHVVKYSNNDILVFKAKDEKIDHDTPLVASVIYADADEDFCLLKVEGLNGTPLGIRECHTLKPGEPVYTLSSPRDFPMGITKGTISAFLSAGRKSRVIQTDAEFNPGSSGGGLFDRRGNLIALLTYEHLGSRFAVPADWAYELELDSSAN